MLDGVQDVKRTHQGRLHVDEAEGWYRWGPGARRATTGTVAKARAAAFGHDGCQHAKAIAEGVQVAHPVDPGVLETWNFNDVESFRRYPQMDQRLDLEAVAPQHPVAPR